MSVISRAIGRAVAIAVVAGALMLTGCQTTHDEPPFFGGVTDEIVEVYRVSEGQDPLVAVMWRERATSHSGEERWLHTLDTDLVIWPIDFSDPSLRYVSRTSPLPADFTEFCSWYCSELKFGGQFPIARKIPIGPTQFHPDCTDCP